MKFLLVLLCGLLGACDAPRPEGAWTPKYPDAGLNEASNDFDGEDNDDEDDDSVANDAVDTDEEGADVVASRPDGGPKPTIDAGGTIMVDPKSPFNKIVGRYLMRLDSYSTVDTVDGSNKLHVENRVSNLMFVTLTDVDGKLMSDERMCDQTYQNVCGQGCNSWTTTLDELVRKKRFPNAKVQREYKIEGDTLTAEEATLPLGFDAAGPNAATPLPSSITDAKVWRLEGSDVASPNPKRVGMRTRILAQLKTSGALPVMANFDCTVVTVQRLTTSFTIEGIDLGDRQTLEGGEAAGTVYYLLNTDNAKLETIDATPASSSSSLTKNLCTIAQFKNQNPVEPLDVVSFKRVDDLAGCPTTGKEFEDLFQGSVNRPKVR